MQLCQICKKTAATVHVTEISSYPVVEPGEESTAEPTLEQKHICDKCAARSKVPFSGVEAESKSLAMLNMLKESARRVREESALTCPDCGMTFTEFRSRGRFGCPKDYEIFKDQLQPLLLRIHNATKHVSTDSAEGEEMRNRRQALTDLKERLEQAVQSESYESAAQIRDEIKQLERPAE